MVKSTRLVQREVWVPWTPLLQNKLTLFQVVEYGMQMTFASVHSWAWQATMPAKNACFKGKMEEAQEMRFGGKKVWQCIRDLPKGNWRQRFPDCCQITTLYIRLSVKTQLAHYLHLWKGKSGCLSWSNWHAMPTRALFSILGTTVRPIKDCAASTSERVERV